MKTKYETPAVITLLYVLAGVVALIAVIAMIVSLSDGNGIGGVGLFIPAICLFVMGYGLDLLARILHEVQGIRAQGEVTASAAEKRDDPDYLLMLNKKPDGPYPLSVLLNRLTMGTLLGDAQVQRVGTKSWVELATLQK